MLKGLININIYALKCHNSKNKYSIFHIYL